MVLLGALALLAAASTAIAQLPAGLDSAAQAAWLSLARQKYGLLYAPLRWLGWFQVHRSAGFLTLLGLLGLNTLACTLRRLRSLSRGIRRGRWASFGSLLTHLAVISLLLTWTLSSAYARPDDRVALAPGGIHPLPLRSELLLRCDGLRVQYGAQGQPMDYVAQVTVLSGPEAMRTAEVRPGAPLRVGGVGVWLISYQPGVRVHVLGEDGQALPVKAVDSEASGTLNAGNGVIVNLGGGSALVNVPDARLELHISTAAPLEGEVAFHLQAWRPGVGEPAVDRAVASGEEVVAGGVRITLHDETYAVYRLKRDPLAVGILLSALALVVGTGLATFGRSERHP
jgi:hypothetical protein